MLLSTKQLLSMSCSGTIDTWVDEALDVLHHQLTGQTNGMLEVSRGHVPVRMVFMATAKPKGHHRKEKVNNRIDAKPWSWKRKVSIRIVTLAPLLQQNGSAKWQQRASHLFPLSQELPILRRSKEREFTTDWETYGLWWHFSFLFLHDFNYVIRKYTR